MGSRGALAVLASLALAFSLGIVCSSPTPIPHEKIGHALFTSPQANPIALSPDATRVYVANTTSHTVSVIDATSNSVLVPRIRVGLEPVSVAARPDGLRLAVANHVSDSISIINTDPTSADLHEVIATVQDLDANGASRIDEPVGLAFDGNFKIYVALSSSNRIAVVDEIFGVFAVRASKLSVRGQEPRAIAVRNGKLYVAAFESNNQTVLSICPGEMLDGEFCTLDENDIIEFATNPNLPSDFKNIVPDPLMPDDDVFVFDTSTHVLLDDVQQVGTLLYGLAVDSNDRVFVTQTHARNDVNGKETTDGSTRLPGSQVNLVALDNRIFLNRISSMDCTGGTCSFTPASDIFDLEPPPPSQPAAGMQLATPYGIAISDDDKTLVVTAAASSRVFTVNVDASASGPGCTGFGEICSIVDVGAIPRGVALRSSSPTGAPETAYVLNTLDNTVSVVDVTNRENLSVMTTLSVGEDPTPNHVRLGRIAFNDANASSTGTFSCASCHPDGNTDQLLWRIGGACFFGACSGDDEPRTTMPIRGLKNSLPLHWDGTLGDPFGGGNGAVGGGGSGGTDCALGDADGDHDCFVDLVMGSLAGVMCDQDPASNPAGCPPGGNELSATERENMAFFLASVSYPPARGRRLDDSVSNSALNGFKDFFMDQNAGGNPDTCADSDAGCHELPLGAATNSATLNGFDAPTMRGMTDRFLQFSLGPTAPRKAQIFFKNSVAPLIGVTAPFVWDANVGIDEKAVFGAAFTIFTPVYNVGPANLFQMFEEASTGTSGALGRQVTLSTISMSGERLAATQALLDDLEAADARGVINLRGRGLRSGQPRTISYDSDAMPPVYLVGPSDTLTRTQLEAEAMAGTFLVTLTALLREDWGRVDYPQPLLGDADQAGSVNRTGDPVLPRLPYDDPMTFTASEARSDLTIYLDGNPVGGTVDCCDAVSSSGSCTAGTFGPFCSGPFIQISLDSTPANGTHLLQLQSGHGPLSNEIPICVDDASSNQPPNACL